MTQRPANPRRRMRGAAVCVPFVVLLLAVIAPAHAARDDLVLVSRVSGASGPRPMRAPHRPRSRPTGASSPSPPCDQSQRRGPPAATRRSSCATSKRTTTTLASRATGPAGEGADDYALGASLSADGRLVAFESRADNLSADDADETIDAFVRDLQHRDDDADESRERHGRRRRRPIRRTRDVRRRAPRRVPLARGQPSGEDDDWSSNVFVHDLQPNTTILVSRRDRRGARRRRLRGVSRSRPMGDSSRSRRPPTISAPRTTTTSRTSSSATWQRTPRRM